MQLTKVKKKVSVFPTAKVVCLVKVAVFEVENVGAVFLVVMFLCSCEM